MSKASENDLAQSVLCLSQKNPSTSHYREVSELPVKAGKLWNLFFFSSCWLPPLSSKFLKSLFVVTVIPARCCRLHVRDSLKDLGLVKCNCTEPKTKCFFFFFSFPPPLVLWSSFDCTAPESHGVYVDVFVQPMSFFTELCHYCCPVNGFHMKRNRRELGQWQRCYLDVLSALKSPVLAVFKLALLT